MALRYALLLLSVALAVQATNIPEDDALHQKVNGDLNSVCNELLGVPCKPSPPPPGSSTSSSPPAEAPEEPEAPSSVLGPAPGPAGDGVATGLIELTVPTGVVLSPAQRTDLYALLQAAVSGNGVVTPDTVGRKLLATDLLPFTVTGVLSCADLVTVLDTYVQSGKFAEDASSESIPVEAATLLSLLCTGPDSGVASVTNIAPPSTAPAPAPARR